ncbi:MAG: class I SAM-dependent methyltransferase [Anaerolineales bacterium]
MNRMAAIVLKAGREKSVKQHHPWIFSGAVANVYGNPKAGETVDVLTTNGNWLGRAAFNPFSNIRARLWTWDETETIDTTFFKRRLSRAIGSRRGLYPEGDCLALRLVYAESDGIPGLIVDRYADWLVVQFLTAGVEYWRDVVIDTLVELTGIRNIYERSDVDTRKLEGLKERSGPLTGQVPPEFVRIEENGLHFLVDVRHGQKTGFYLDQRLNRQRVRALASGRRVLNCFCYTGAFTVCAVKGGAVLVHSVDSSAEALEIARQNLALNGGLNSQVSWQEGDVFQVLRQLRDRNETFDMIILDPPKFAPTTSQVEKAARGYKDINLLGFKLLNPGGLLVTFSCSGGVSLELFQKIVADAALDAGASAQIVEHLWQAPDHPVALNFPEAAYLKGLVCRKL